MQEGYFTSQTFGFLEALAANNNRDWFQEHKADYEAQVRQPALTFISAMADELPAISPHFLAVPKKVGGSLMRVNRDIRFGKDKRPYKTNVGIQFRHEMGKDVHAPGFYLHIEANECFAGAGIWRPDAQALGKIRDAIVDNPTAWLAARDDKRFSKHLTLEGESLRTYPRGYSKEHPLIDDIKRKDFIAVAALTAQQVTSPKLLSTVLQQFEYAAPLMRFLCRALDVRY